MIVVYFEYNPCLAINKLKKKWFDFFITKMYEEILQLSRLKKNGVENGYIGDEVSWRYYKGVLMDKIDYLLHFTIAILSFLFCGLVPPLVYAFSFVKTGKKDLKMAAAAGASLSCTAILAVQKAHIQKPQNWNVYAKTVAAYVSIGAMAFGLSYLAGYMIGKLTDKLPWDL